jgi:hypothetical protein
MLLSLAGILFASKVSMKVFSTLLLLLLLPSLILADNRKSTFRCRFALSSDRAELVLNEANHRSNNRILDGLRNASVMRAKNLNSYLSKLDVRDLSAQLQSAHLASDILSLIYGDKLSMIKKWTSPSEEYQMEKQQQLAREVILQKGLAEIFSEIGYRSPTFYTRLKIRIRSILKNSGLLWVLARTSLAPFNYREVPFELTEKIILDGWAAHHPEINSFFSQQSKRNLFNDWHNELGLVLGGILAITGYLNYYDQTIFQYKNRQQVTVTQYAQTKSALAQQRELIQAQLYLEQSLIESLDQQLADAPHSNAYHESAKSPRQLTASEQALLRQTIIGEE